jgi:hypothetical protein
MALPARWRFWYVFGADLESCPEVSTGFATEDIKEMLGVNLPGNVTIVIETGSVLQWKNDVVRADTLGHYIYRGNEL